MTATAPSTKIYLKSNDEEVFEVERSVIRLSTTLNTMFQGFHSCLSVSLANYDAKRFPDLGMDQPVAGEAMLTDPIPLANVNGAILRKVITWCQHHKDGWCSATVPDGREDDIRILDMPVSDDTESKERRTDDIPSWDVEFLKVDQGTLFELILVICRFYSI
jgi:S-phase kinase-associated protein 1